MAEKATLTQTIKEKVLAMVLDLDHVSYAEIVKKIPGTRGDNWHVHGDISSNIVYWTGLSDEAISAIDELLSTHSIAMEPAHPFIYIADGMGLSLPQVKQARRYKKPHWLPMVFVRPKPKTLQ